MGVREAVKADFVEITAIYNEVVATSTATFNDRPASCEERIAWWKSRLSQSYPVLVSVEGSRLAGFASFGDFRAWPGYRYTVECTIYIHAEFRGRGVGTRLLKALVERAAALEKHTMIAAVDSENLASLQFLERFGFERAGVLHEVGFKFSRFLDLVLLEYKIAPRSAL